MNLDAYTAARELISKIGQPLLYFALTISIVLVIIGFQKQYAKYTRPLRITVFLTLFSGFFLIIWYHFQIYNYLPLIDPSSNKIAGRYAIAPWTDNEKLFFWTLLTSIWLVFIRSRKLSFDGSLNIIIAVFLALTIFTSNPFVSPLKGFHEQITGLNYAMQSADKSTLYQYFYQAKGMMDGFYNSVYMWIHPPLLFLAYSTFVISFFGSLFMLIKKDAEYERFAYSWIKLGYTVLTVGMLLGYPWTVEAWQGQPWWYSPKVNVAIMMWVIYSAYLHSRLYLHRKGMFNTTAAIGILGFVSVVATYLATYVLPGIHSVKGY